MQDSSVTALQEKLCAVAASASRHRSINRPEHTQRIGRISGEESASNFEKLVSIAVLMCRRTNQGQACERRPASILTLPQGLICDRGITSIDQLSPKRMLGESGLYENLAGGRFPSRATGNLYDGLRHPLGAAKVRTEQSLIGVNDANQRQARKMMSFGEHLRANQYVGITAGRACQRLVHRAFSLCAVTVDTSNGCRRKSPVKRLLQFFGAFSEWRNGFAALIAMLIERSLESTVVAAQLTAAGVDR